MNSEMQEDYEGQKDEIAVVVKIEEGPQTRVGRCKSWGATAFLARPLDADG